MTRPPNQQLTGGRFIWLVTPTYSPIYSTVVLACGKAEYLGELQMVHEAAHTVDRKQRERPDWERGGGRKGGEGGSKVVLSYHTGFGN